MADPRKCCVLGVCCPPGSPEQRAALKAWLLGHLFGSEMPGKLYGPDSDTIIEAWLDELPWKREGDA